MTRALVLAIALALPAPAAALERWTAADTAAEAAYLTLHVADWMQTATIARRPGWSERANLVLGAHPSTGAVNRWFAATALGHVVVARVLPQPWRRAWQVLTIGVEAGVVANNARLGIGFSLPW